LNERCGKKILIWSKKNCILTLCLECLDVHYIPLQRQMGQFLGEGLPMFFWQSRQPNKHVKYGFKCLFYNHKHTIYIGLNSQILVLRFQFLHYFLFCFQFELVTANDYYFHRISFISWHFRINNIYTYFIFWVKLVTSTSRSTSIVKRHLNR